MEKIDERKKLSDEKLFELCKKYGTQAKLWRQKFIGLLPEVYRRKLYGKKGFNSIFEFAAKLAGLSHEQVRLTLNIERRFEDKPTLKNLLVNGEASINKLARVVSIATPENEEELAEKIKLLPNRALEVLVRDEKSAQQVRPEEHRKGATCENLENKNGYQKTSFEGKGLHVQPSEISISEEKLKVELSPDIVQKLNELHAKGIDVNEFLRAMLQKRETEIAAEKREISENLPPTSLRYIPVRVQKIVKAEFGEKCSIKTCPKPSKVIHHTQRFSLSHSHDPNFLAPLCAEHHIIAHAIDQKFIQVRKFQMVHKITSSAYKVFHVFMKNPWHRLPTRQLRCLHPEVRKAISSRITASIIFRKTS